MEAGTLQVFLRVLYTVNSNPQYILAKSASRVPVITCNETTAQSMGDPVYARAPLKACLAAVCGSSPELLQDHTRDFSLYFLDPLESQPQHTGLIHAPHSTNSPPGVAVALGLMSWALHSDDSTSVYVTGTIIPDAPALEVVCALRETKRMPKPMLYSYPPLGPVSVSGPSQFPYLVRPSQTTGTSCPSSSPLMCSRQQQQTLIRSADFPELYIGPPRRGRGRPEGSTSLKSKLKAQSRASSPGARSSEVVNSQSESKQVLGKEANQKIRPRPSRLPPTHSPFVCAPLARGVVVGGSDSGTSVFGQGSQSTSESGKPAFHHQAQSHTHPTHSPLLGVISAITSTSGASAVDTTPEQQANLISALRELLTANPHLLRLAATSKCLSMDGGGTAAQDTHESNYTDNGCDDGDSDIVILDSSTIDTSAFRKSSIMQRATDGQAMSPFVVSQESPVLSNAGATSSPPLASTPPSVQENTLISSQTPTPSGGLELPTVIADAGMPSACARSVGNHPLDTPATPTPSRTYKRNLDEYSQSTPTSPPSPSPLAVCTSSSGRVTAKHLLLTGRTSSASTRLPSMLASIRAVGASGSQLQSNSLGPSTRGYPAASTIQGSGNQSGLLSASGAGTALNASSLKRRRTLSEFMAEHEARENTKARRLSSRRKLAPTRSANVGLTSRYPQTSPPRPLFRSDSMASAFPLSTSPSQPGTVASTVAQSPVTTLASAGPSGSISTATRTKNPFINFVMPAWAQTSTAMLPRLSEEALARQQAEREARKVQASLRRREAAKAKRKRPHRVDRLSKDSDDSDHETTASAEKRRTPPPSSSVVAWSAPVTQPLPALPVFASGIVASIASSPPRTHHQPTTPATPSTPPRKPDSLSGSGSRRAPCSLFTPSGQSSTSLFTPSTPSVTRSQTRARLTPHSPTMLQRPGTKRSPRKSVLQTPRTPRRNGADRPTPSSLHTDRHLLLASPSMTVRTPQTQKGMNTRTFLLPPPSPCALRTPQRSERVTRGLALTVFCDSGIQQAAELAVHRQNVKRRDGEKGEENIPSRELDEALLEEGVTSSPAQCHFSRAKAEPDGINTGDGVDPAEEYASSPLPPSSPPLASPLSSPGPAKYDVDTRLPITSETNDQRAAEAAWLLSDDSVDPTAAWFTDSEAGAWFTETDAWLTDIEGGPLPTDSDGACLSDSDAVSSAFGGDIASSFASWLSDEADVGETSVEVGASAGARTTKAQDDAGFDTAAFRKAYAALVECGGGNAKVDGILGRDKTASSASPQCNVGMKGAVDSGFWESMQPLLGEGATNDAPGAV